jgi:hypothetical protein
LKQFSALPEPVLSLSKGRKCGNAFDVAASTPIAEVVSGDGLLMPPVLYHVEQKPNHGSRSALSTLAFLPGRIGKSPIWQKR